MKDYKDMDGDDWCRLLRRHPELAEQCTAGGYWSKLDESDWSWLLRVQPQLSEHCNWAKLSGGDWYWLLRRQPQLCDTEELMLMAVSKTKRAFDFLIDPPERVRKLHHLKWVL